MGNLYHQFLSHFLTAFFCLSLLAPQYVLGISKISSRIHAEKQRLHAEKQKKPKESLPKDTPNETTTPRDVLNNILAQQQLKFPNFNQSILRHPSRINKYNELFVFPNKNPAILEFRLAKKNFESLYNKNLAYFTLDKDAPDLIPKIVHQIWLGSEVPEKFALWMASWMNIQGWQYKLWTDRDVEEFSLHNRELYDAAQDYGKKSDILRYEIIYREGGIYADVDFENVYPEMFEQLSKSFDFFAGLEPMEHHQPINSLIIGNALFGSVPGHPILERIILDMKDHYNKFEEDWAVQATGPVYFTTKINEYNQSPNENYNKNIMLPPSFFFPLTFTEVRTNIKTNFTKYIKPETAAIHYWSGSWRDDLNEGASNTKKTETKKIELKKTDPQKPPKKKKIFPRMH